MKEIQLTQGFVALVDDEDYERLKDQKWHVKRYAHTAYAQTNALKPDGSRTMRYMHRIILGLTDPAIQADHIDGNGLDNRRQNLRIASKAENLRNRSRSRNNTSGFKGVYRATRNRLHPWRTLIKAGKLISGGYYSTAIEAAFAYNELALKHHGEFAKLNEMADKQI